MSQPEPKLFNEMRDTIEVALINMGINPRESVALATAATSAVIERYRGVSLYVPHGLAQKRTRRDRLIRLGRSHGASIAELAHKHHLAESQIYRILRQPL